jgi:hypothetical protein
MLRGQHKELIYINECQPPAKHSGSRNKNVSVNDSSCGEDQVFAI